MARGNIKRSTYTWWFVAIGVAAAFVAIASVSAATVSPSPTSDNKGVVFPFAETFFQFADGKMVCNRTFYYELKDFLTPAQCDELREAAVAKGMSDSKVGEATSSLDRNVRRSKQTWFKHSDHHLAKHIQQKVKSMIFGDPRFDKCFEGVDENNDFEDVQVVRYEQEGKYDPHYDATECGDDVDVECTPRQRIATVLIYLNDDFEGGETRFPNLNVSIKPKKGSAVFFWVSDMRSRLVYSETLHGGDPVKNGEKWIATQWVRAPSSFSK